MGEHADLIRDCMELLTEMGCTVRRQNAGRVGRVYLGPKDVPDIAGHTPHGQAIYVEVKVGKDKVRPGQRAFLDAAIECGCLAFVVRGVDELESDLEYAARNKLIWPVKFKEAKEKT